MFSVSKRIASPVTAWDFYRFRANIGLRYAVAGIDLERTIELPWAFNKATEAPFDALLDLGARNSVFPMFAAWKTNAIVTAIDADPAIVDQKTVADRLAHKLGFPANRITYQCQDATRLSFDDDSFDVVTCISMIEHIPGNGDSDAMREIGRILKPGGRLILTIPCFREYREEFHQKNVYDRTYEGAPVFFGRIYDDNAINTRLLSETSLKLMEKSYYGQPGVNFGRFWWRLPFHVKLPFRWATPAIGPRIYKRIPSLVLSKGLVLGCFVFKKYDS